MAGGFISLTVRADGSVTAETHEVLGARCLDYIAVLEDLLDAQVLSSEFTADYDRAPTIATTRADVRNVEQAGE